MVSVNRSASCHTGQVREADAIGDGSDIDERRPSRDRKRGHGKALDWRVGGYGGAAEMEERSTRPADHMGIRQRRRLPEIAEITQDGLAFEPLCQRRLASSAQLSMSPPGGGGCAEHAQDTCLHGNALHPERQTGTRPGPI